MRHSVRPDETMQALVFEGPGRLVLRSIPRPLPGEGEVLVRIHTAAICGSDLRIVAGTKTRDVRVGHPIGHEGAGTVAAAGAGVREYQPGEAVVVCVVESCGRCACCLAGRENLCEGRRTLGYHTDGAFAEYMLIPSHAVARGNLFKLPASVDLAWAPLIEPLACCINGQDEMGLSPGSDSADASWPESLVIFGAGPIGLMHLLLARARCGTRLRQVVVVEPRASRREIALRLGADETCAPEEFKATERFDAAIVAVGVPELASLAVNAVRRCGRVSLFAGFPVKSVATIDPNAIHYRQVRVYGASESRRSDFAAALALAAGGKLDLAALVTHRFPLAEHDEAFRLAADGSALKVVLDIRP